MAGERFDWERISQQIEAECGPGWNSHDFGGFEAVNSIDLFLRVLRAPIDEASVAGLADTFGKSLWGALVENPSDPGDLGAAHKSVSTCVEPFLKKVCLLSGVARPKKSRPGLQDWAVALKLRMVEPGSEEKKMPGKSRPDMHYAFARFRQSRNDSGAHSAPRLSKNEYWARMHDLLVVCLSAVCLHANELRDAIEEPEELGGFSTVLDRTFRDLSRAWSRDPNRRDGLELTLNATRQRRGDLASDSIDRGTVEQIQSEVPRFILLGDPGTGKTTILKYLAWRIAARKAEKPSRQLPLPVVIELRRISRDRDLATLLREQVGVAKNERRWLRENDVLLLVDGLNEILDANLRQTAILDLEEWMGSFSGLQVVVSARPWNRQLPDLPVFRLQALSEASRREYLCARVGEELAGRMERSAPQVLQLAQTPFMLEMLAEQLGQTREIPKNAAQLLGSFLHQLMMRSSLRSEDREISRKQRLLAELGFQSRDAGKVTFTEDFYVDVLSETARELNFELDPYQLRDEFFQDGILRADGDSGPALAGIRYLSFEHESFQEYFAARCLLHRAHSDPHLIAKLAKDPDWTGPLEILRGLPGAPSVPEVKPLKEQASVVSIAEVSRSPRGRVIAPVEAQPTVRKESAAETQVRPSATPAKPTQPLLAAIRARNPVATWSALKATRKGGGTKKAKQQARDLLFSQLRNSFAGLDDLGTFALDCLERISGSELHSSELIAILRSLGDEPLEVEGPVRERAWALYQEWHQAIRHRPAPHVRAQLVLLFDLGARLSPEEMQELVKGSTVPVKLYLRDVIRNTPIVRPVPKASVEVKKSAPVSAQQKVVAVRPDGGQESSSPRPVKKSVQEERREQLLALLSQDRIAAAMQYISKKKDLETLVLGEVFAQLADKVNGPEKLDHWRGKACLRRKKMQKALVAVGADRVAREHRAWETDEKRRRRAAKKSAKKGAANKPRKGPKKNKKKAAKGSKPSSKSQGKKKSPGSGGKPKRKGFWSRIFGRK
ncbi:MAG: hypothetical protein CMJ94_14800 [Planctomycetes bacterium]|nr:hypothetical protein [Planctomycetota bacterium]